MSPLRERQAWSGTLSGVALAFADWAASGLGVLPGTLVLATFAFGVGLGLLADLGSRWVRSAEPRGGAPLVLAAAIALEGLSIASKELDGGQRLLGAGLAACAAGLALIPARAPLPYALLPILSLPPAAGILYLASASPWIHLACLVGPLGVVYFQACAPRLASSAASVAMLGLLAVLQPRSAALPDLPPAPSVALPPEQPSVVWLVIDTLRADALDKNGTLAQFAREGVEFRQCVSVAPWTLPSVGSLLTGVYPSQHGALRSDRALSSDVETAAELLRARGYATGAFTGGAFVGPGHGLQRGFEAFDPSCERRFSIFGRRTPLLWRIAKNRFLPQRWLLDWVDAYRGLEGAVEAGLRWAASQEGRPRFLFLHTYQVHDYFLYEPDFDDETLRAIRAPSPRFAGRLWTNPAEFAHASASDLAYFEALYHGRVRALERRFPSIVQRVNGVLGESTVWIVTADHGEGFDAERHRVHHGGRLHEDLLRVPLIVRAPGMLPGGRTIDETVRTIDVLPTTLDLLGIEPPPQLAGISLLPALRGTGPFPEESFAEDRQSTDLVALRRAGWKWIHSPGHQELYHLTEDPLERQPLDEQPPQELSARLSSFLERFPSTSGLAVKLDPSTQEQLDALGYGGQR